jgi:hypothetical protein
MSDTTHDPSQDRGETQPDESDPTAVLLQIALAIAIILGYLLSDGLNVQAALSGQLQHSQQQVTGQKKQLARQGQTLERQKQDLDAVRATPHGQALVQNAAQAEEIQRLKLLNAWKSYRPTRPLAGLLTQMDDVSHIRLAPDRGFLPDEPAYAKLLAESARAFLEANPAEQVSRKEVAALLAATWEQAGFKGAGREEATAEAARRAFSPEPFPDKAELNEIRLGFDPDRPSLENLVFVADVIRKDLAAERQQLARLQYRLITRIAEVRPYAPSEELSSSDGREILRRVVSDLSKPLGLLPEVVQRLTSL